VARSSTAAELAAAATAPDPPGIVIRDPLVNNTDPTQATSGPGGGEPSVAINPANPAQIAITSFRGCWAFCGSGNNAPLFYSQDGGLTWTQYFSIPAPPGQTGASGCPCDQTIDFGRNGVLFGTFLLDNGAPDNVVTGSTADPTSVGAWHWNGSPAQLTNFARLNSADQPQLLVNRDPTTASQDNAFVAYDDFSGSPDARVSVAQPAANPPVMIRDVKAGTESPLATNPGLRLAKDPRNGTMYALYQQSTGAAQPKSVTYLLNRSQDAGVTWTLNGSSNGLVVATAPSEQSPGYKFGSVNALLGGVDHAAVDPTTGDVYVVFGRDSAGIGGNQIYIVRLTDNGAGGLTVGSPSLVSSAAANAALPSIAILSDGTIGVLYDTFDGVNTSGFPLFSAHLARSSNKGVSFSDVVLQQFASPATNNGDARQRVLGDYQQLKAQDGVFYGVYSGNRNGFGSSISTIDPAFFKTVPDSTPPSCTLTSVIAGPPTQIKVTVQDSDGGLKSVQVITLDNATANWDDASHTNIPLDGFAPVTAGDTTAHVVTATKTVQGVSSHLGLEVIDLAGNVTDCDPVVLSASTSRGQPVSTTLNNLSSSEGRVTVQNGTPGVDAITLEINGRHFSVAGLKDGESRTIDISSALQAGKSNTATVTGLGQPGGTAALVFGN
jgi:hypothetical protein